MSLAANLATYSDVKDLADKALAAERGVAVSFLAEGSAIHFRHRIYKFRTLDRKESSDGKSIYDNLVATISRGEKNGKVVFDVEIRKLDTSTLEVREL